MTQEYDTTTERKLWFSGAWGRSLPTSFLQFGPDCIACCYYPENESFLGNADFNMLSAESYAILRNRMNSLTAHFFGIFLLRDLLLCLISKRLQLVLFGIFLSLQFKDKTWILWLPGHQLNVIAPFA